ncbi:MAG TPA: hypothetical protein VGH58_01280 [Solirubrobacterales bacterium]|jgi:hypothetical protein
MRVLLKEGAEKATAASILVLPQEIETTFGTLSGEAVPEGGIVAQADYSTVARAVATGAKDRAAQSATPEELFKQAVWMARVLSSYEVGSKIGLQIIGRGWALDASEAKRIDRAEGLSVGDAIAVGPTIDSQTLINARGRVVSFIGERVWVELDAGDRDRIERATARKQPKCLSFPRLCVEKVK